MSAFNHLTIEFLRQCFRYESGRLFWLERPREHFRSDPEWKRCNARFFGKEAGTPNPLKSGNQWRVALNKVLIPRKQIVWAMHKGEWAVELLDHKNRNSVDDRIENLRPATRSQKCASFRKRSDNTSGYKGVSWDRNARKWKAAINVGDGRDRHLGLFTDPAKAHRTYLKALKKAFGKFACAG